jgi:tRNA nucleotidyltransferase/poly(A) polymerase
MILPEFVKTILERLFASGREGYVVGGAVRDACLGRTVTDWDVATDAEPHKIKGIFEGIKSFSLKHGTVTVVQAGRHYEISTYRGDGGQGESISEDLAHRDFTVNAMAYDPRKGNIIDPHGGMQDLQRGIVRAVGRPEERFREDPLRLLRGVRIAAELQFRLEPKTLKTISKMAHRLGAAAKERIRDELMKVLLTARPSKGFNLMLRTGLLGQVLPELQEGYLKRQNAYHRYTIYKHTMETVDHVRKDPVLRLTALLHDIAKPRVRKKIDGEWRFLGHEEASAVLARDIMKRLKFSHDMTKRVTGLIANHMTLVDYHSRWSDGAVRRWIRRVGPENISDSLELRRADIVAHAMGEQKLDLLKELEDRVIKITKKSPPLRNRDLAIDGHTVMETLGIGPGPEVGRILRGVMEKVTEQPELNTKESLVDLLRRMA